MWDRPRIAEEVKQVLTGYFELDEKLIKPDSLIVDELGLDSLDAVDLLMRLEEKIGIDVELEKFRTAKTLEDVCSVLEGVVSKQRAERNWVH